MRCFALRSGSLAVCAAFIWTQGSLVLAQGAASGRGDRVGGIESSRTHPTIPETAMVAGARIGLNDVDGLDDTVASFGAFVDYSVGNNVLVGGTLDYWSDSSGSMFNQSVDVSDLTLGANGKLIFTGVNVPMRPFLLGGLALHRIDVSYSEQDVTDRNVVDRFKERYSDSDSEFGIDVGGGVMYRLQRSIDLLGEVRMRRLNDRSIDLDQLAFSGAVAYVM